MKNEVNMERSSFKVRKMGCQSCVTKVTAALRAIPGVEVVEVVPGRAVINRRAADVRDESIVAALKDAGYDAAKEV